ncbi:MAG: hypothetical protein LBF87_00075 [Treponema sp.]|nr:hypothetical protein [Treponema sp.]
MAGKLYANIFVPSRRNWYWVYGHPCCRLMCWSALGVTVEYLVTVVQYAGCRAISPTTCASGGGRSCPGKKNAVP